jgi:hypothetical protein
VWSFFLAWNAQEQDVETVGGVGVIRGRKKTKGHPFVTGALVSLSSRI